MKTKNRTQSDVLISELLIFVELVLKINEKFFEA